MNKSEEIRQRFRDAYKSSGVTLMKLEEMTGIGHSIIQRYLKGETKKMDVADFLTLCYAMGSDPRTVLGWNDEPEDPKKKELSDLMESLPQSDKDKVVDFAVFLSNRAQKQ